MAKRTNPKSLTRPERLNVLSVPFDILPEGAFEDTINDLVEDQKPHQLVLLGLWDFIRARGRSMYAKTVRDASLVIPTSKTVARIAQFIYKRALPRYLPFDFVVKLLTAIESKARTVYLIGSRPGSLQVASSNVRGSFPNLQIVGRCAGYYTEADEENILLAIRKSAPTLVLAGNGLSGRDKWLFAYKDKFGPGLSLWCGPCIEMFAGRIKRTSRNLWNKGLDFVPDFLKHPWRIYRLFVYIWLGFIVLYSKIKKN